MPALGYKKPFVALVKSGAKPHSIRSNRKRLFKKGDTLMHYYGMRTKQCQKIRPDTACIAAGRISINAKGRQVYLHDDTCYYNAGLFDQEAVVTLAARDGFKTTDEFFKFFLETHGEIFTGQLVEWRP